MADQTMVDPKIGVVHVELEIRTHSSLADGWRQLFNELKTWVETAAPAPS